MYLFIHITYLFIEVFIYLLSIHFLTTYSLFIDRLTDLFI